MSETPTTTETTGAAATETAAPTGAAAPADAAAPTADAAAADAAPTTGAEADALIAARRRRIDDLDGRIIALVRERMEVSGEIQAARIGSGGRRVHLARELQVLRTYGDALGGRSGTAVAMTLLELCRGRA